MRHLGNWTAEQRAELVAIVKTQAQAQIESDPELRAMVDWMIEAVGMEPSSRLYSLVFLVSAVMFSTVPPTGAPR